MRVVGCFLEHDGKFVLLRRHSHKPEGGTLGLPGGKVEPGESDQQAVIRELIEETGYSVKNDELELLGEFSFETSEGKPYVYVTYKVQLDADHDVVLEDSAHSEFMWLTPEECYGRTDLIKDLKNLLQIVGYINR